MNILSMENISKSYGEKILFTDISFSIADKQRIGIIGVNGTGKSTLLKIIAGMEEADQGKVIHANGFRVEYLAQNPLFDHQSTVLENVFLGDSPLMQLLREYEQTIAELEADPLNEQKQGRLLSLQQRMDAMNAWEASTQAKAVLTRLGIQNYHQSVSQLSGGQRKRVAMASALIHPADLLILDEPTNHIDNETVEWLEEYLSRFNGALLIVTHDRYFLNRVTNRMIELDRGKLYSYTGNYEYFLEKKSEREAGESASESKRQNLLRRELAWLRRGAKARTTKQKARINRVSEIQERNPDSSADQLDISIGSSRLGKKVFEINKISKSYAEQALIQDFSHIVVPEDRIGIIGANGSGKSTLLHMLTGRIQPDSGEIGVGQTVKIAHYTQENTEMNEQLRVIDYIKEVAEVIQTVDGHKITAAQMLERFLFPPHIQWTPIAKLSGGERRRLYLLRTLMSEPNVLLLDEPTNDLDIQTLAILEDYLEHFLGAVIIVSHDRYFLDRTADHLLVFEGKGKIRRFIGNYTDYLEQKKMANETSTPPITEKPKKEITTKADAKLPLKLSYKEQKEWDEIENRIADLEEQSNQLKKEISLAASDIEKVQRLYEKEQHVSSELEETMERWTVLSLLLEEIENNKL